MSQNFVRPQLQIAVCDDESYARKRIQRLLENCLEKREISYTITLYGSGREFLEKPENLTGFDVVFLDINMEEIDGIQTAERIRSFHADTYLVFITSYIHYALEGYRVNAVRYILKETLDTALEECVDAILERMRISYVTFSFIQGERKLYTDNLLCVESRGHKSVFYYLENGKNIYEIYEKLDQIEERLEGFGFLRVHKSYLVNQKHIRQICNYRILLDTGEEIPVPRSRYQQTKEAFAAYKGGN